VLYRASRVTASLVYQKRSLRLIGSDEPAMPHDVEVRYRGHPVERLTKTHLVLWNSGKATIRGTDIVEDDPIRCEFLPESQVLEVSVVQSTRLANKVFVKPVNDHSNWAIITFDYLDPQDGATIEILHTDSNRYPAVMGTIRGLPRGVVDRGRILGRRGRVLRLPFGTNVTRNVFSLTIIVLGLIMILSAVVPPGSTFDAILNYPNSTESRRWIQVVTGGVFVLQGVAFFWLILRRYPALLHTPELDN